MERSFVRIVGGWHIVNFKNDLYQVEQACENQSSRAQAQPISKQVGSQPNVGPRVGWKKEPKVRFKLGPEIGLRCYLLIVEVAERRVLGSLSVPGIFQGPGDTVAFLPAALLILELWLGLLSWLICPFSGSFGRALNGTRGPCWLLLPSRHPFPPFMLVSVRDVLGESRLRDGVLLRSLLRSLDFARLLLWDFGSPANSSRYCCWPFPPLERRLVLLPSLCLVPPPTPPAKADLFPTLACSRALLSEPLGPWQESGPTASKDDVWGGSVGGFTWEEADGLDKLSRGGATSDRLGEAVGWASQGAGLSCL